MADRVFIVRHGETEWSRAGKHTGRTDLPLTEAGRAQAEELGAFLSGVRFVRVFTSPLSRAASTAALAGYPDAEQLPDLMEWDYGEYEGRTTAEIRASRRHWSLWTDGCPGGEMARDVGARADRVITRVRKIEGDVALFAHGHELRVLTARWLELSPVEGRRFSLPTCGVGVLGWERENAVIMEWTRPSK